VRVKREGEGRGKKTCPVCADVNEGGGFHEWKGPDRGRGGDRNPLAGAGGDSRATERAPAKKVFCEEATLQKGTTHNLTLIPNRKEIERAVSGTKRVNFEGLDRKKNSEGQVVSRKKERTKRGCPSGERILRP